MKDSFSLCLPIVIIILLLEVFNVAALPTLPNGETFDFIIVGAGTAGCVVAQRLAENGKHSVLLISEGGIPHPDFDVPALATNMTLMTDPKFVKTYQTVPQRNAGLAQNGRLKFFVGKLLGGGSGMNAGWLNRGNPQDYNNWGELTGDQSWKYASLLEYFRKYETYTGNNPTDQRGFSGPITASVPKYTPGLLQWLQGGVELGYSKSDPNGPQTEGFTHIEYSRNKGRRVSSYKGYIEPMIKKGKGNMHLQPNKSNLVILTHTLAKRIMFQENKAVGVRLTRNSAAAGQEEVGYAQARKEIIVSAGALDSPALLMKSGIGPRSVLDKAKIPVVNELPVGRNLQDHVSLPITVVFGNRSMTFNPKRELTPEAWKLFEETGEGPYSSYSGQSGQAFLTSSLISPVEKQLHWPDLHLAYLHLAGESYSTPSLPKVEDLQAREVPVSWISMLGRPKSRGNVTLDPENIDNPPLIDFQYLTQRDDIEALVDGIKILIKLCEETKAFQQVGCRLPAITVPACDHLNYRSDPYWHCYAKQMTSTFFHAAGSCKMGDGLKDPEAVVDTKLRVIGIENLRVVDASIMPTITNANTQGAVYVIAEKAADMILNRWGDSSQ